jgi:hypothetical protein
VNRQAGSSTLEQQILDLYTGSDYGDLFKFFDYDTMYQTDTTDTPVTSSGQSLGRIEGARSTNQVIATQALSATRLTTTDDSGYLGCQASGVNDHLLGALGATINQPLTIAMQFYNNGSGGTQVLGSVSTGDSATNLAEIYTDTNKVNIYAGNIIAGTTTITTGDFYYVLAEFNTTSSAYSLDGTSEGSGNAGSFSGFDSVQIGYNSSVPMINVHLGKMMVISRLLTADEKNDVVLPYFAVQGDA